MRSKERESEFSKDCGSEAEQSVCYKNIAKPENEDEAICEAKSGNPSFRRIAGAKRSNPCAIKRRGSQKTRMKRFAKQRAGIRVFGGLRERSVAIRVL